MLWTNMCTSFVYLKARRPKWQALADNVQNVQIDFFSAFLAPYQQRLGEIFFFMYNIYIYLCVFLNSCHLVQRPN